MLGKQGVVERPQTRHMCQKTHEAREPGGGGWKEHTHPAGRPSHPHPTQQRRRPIKHTLLVHEGHSAPPPPCKGPRRETKAAEPPLPASTHPAPPTSPPTPGRLPHSQGHTTDCQCAPSASDHHTRHRRAGDAGQRGHSDHPAVGKTRDPTHTQASTPEQGATAGQGRGEITGAPPHPACNSGNGQVAAKQATGRDRGRPGSETHQGTAPGSSRQRAD